MGITDETGKAITGIADSMKGTPVLLAFLLTIAGFLVFVAYTSGKSESREKAQFELIGKLVNDCRQPIK